MTEKRDNHDYPRLYIDLEKLLHCDGRSEYRFTGEIGLTLKYPNGTSHCLTPSFYDPESKDQGLRLSIQDSKFDGEELIEIRRELRAKLGRQVCYGFRRSFITREDQGLKVTGLKIKLKDALSFKPE